MITIEEAFAIEDKIKSNIATQEEINKLNMFKQTTSLSLKVYEGMYKLHCKLKNESES